METKGMGEMQQNKMRRGRYIVTALLTAVLVVIGIPHTRIGVLEVEASDTPINSTTFPDAVFRRYVMENFDTVGNGFLSDTEKNAVTSIIVRGQSIYSMVGVENFKNLERLDCASTPIRSLDVSQNTRLRELYCFSTQLSSLDVSQNTRLRELYCHTTPISSLDVSQNTALTKLGCWDMQLSSLDVRQNTALTSLVCYGNRFFNEPPFFDTAGLKGFDLSRASDWINASISGTVVTAVDMSSPVTYAYDCGNNYSATFTFLPTPVTYTVNFNANGGSCSTASKTVTCGSTYGTLPTPTRTDYDFTGWYTEPDGGGRVTSNTTVALTGNWTLYAHWTSQADPDAATDEDKAALRETVTEATKNLTEADYTQDSWKKLQDAIDAAQKVISRQNATRDEVTAAVSAIENAKGELKKKAEAEKQEQDAQEQIGQQPGSPQPSDSQTPTVDPAAQKFMQLQPFVKLKVSAGKIKISWKKIPGAEKYYVYYRAGQKGKYKKMKPVKGKSMTLKKIKKTQTYYFKMRAGGKIGGKTVYTQYSKVMSKKSLVAPPAPPKRNPSMAGSVLTLRWGKVKDVSGYVIYRFVNDNKPVKFATVGKNATSYRIDTAKGDYSKPNRYTFYICAYRKQGKKKILGEKSQYFRVM